jgi:hypothetical protein
MKGGKAHALSSRFPRRVRAFPPTVHTPTSVLNIEAGKSGQRSVRERVRRFDENLREIHARKPSGRHDFIEVASDED